MDGPDSNTDADFPPPPAFEDTLMQHRHHGGPPLAPPAPPTQPHTCSSKILVDPNAKKNTASMITNNFHSALSGMDFFNITLVKLGP